MGWSRPVSTAHLVKSAVGSVLYDLHQALLPGELSGRHQFFKTKEPESRLIHHRKEIRPIEGVRFAQGHTEQPIGLGVATSKRDGKVPDCDVGNVPGEVDGEAATGPLAFLIVVETQAHRVVEVEVGRGKGGPAREQKKYDWKHFDLKRQASSKVEFVSVAQRLGGAYTQEERAVAR